MSTASPTKGDPKAPSAAAPGTTEPKAKKEKKAKPEKKERIPYPVPETGLTEWPKDYDRKVHKPLQRKDFANDSIFLIKRAEEHEEAAKRLRHEAETGERLGGVKGDKSRAKKLIKLSEQFEALKAALSQEGIDVASILAGISKPAEAPASA